MAGERKRVKAGRQERLAAALRNNPFLTDEELAELLNVSVPTIRLDRLELGIPELRVRTKEVAEQFYGMIRSLGSGELIGELIDLEIGRMGVSVLEVKADMVFQKSQILRGHYLFAQANSLAVALIGADLVLTRNAQVSFLRPVLLHDLVTAEARVVGQYSNSYHIKVISKVDGEQVFRGQFTVVAKEMSER